MWGSPRRSWPSPDSSAVRAEFGSAADDLLDRIAAVLAVADEVVPDWQVNDAFSAAAKVRVHVQARFPGMDAPALDALCALYSYTWSK